MTKKGPRGKQSERDAWCVGVLFSRSGLMAITESEHFFGTALALDGSVDEVVDSALVREI